MAQAHHVKAAELHGAATESHRKNGETGIARSSPAKALRLRRVFGLGLIGAVGLGGAMVGVDRARACDGLGCVGQAIDHGVRDTGAAIQRGAQATGHVMERGAYDLGTGVQEGVQGAGHAVDDVGQATSRAVNGNP
jgi:hypothetical protein